MTHQNHQTNGASLEDCHTNFFALTELYGIKWRKLVWSESNGGGEEEGGAPLADPVISSYARCLAGDILCVWRRVPQPQPPDLYESSAPAPPPLSLRAAKELWIFWYGEEPDLNGLVAPELIATASQTGEQGSWESGLSYECRSLLFKALHNLIERCLLSRDFVRLGKWFVQPYDGDEEDVGKSPWHLSFSFAFFLHGESTVCASVDVRQHPPVRTLTPKRLAKINAPDQQANAKAYQMNAPASFGTGGDVSGTVHDEWPEIMTRDSMVTVILAPFGLEGTLTGREWSDSDAATARLLDAWRQLYPLEQGCGAVEVVCGGSRMRYPVPYALVTEMERGESSAALAAQLATRTIAALTTPAPHLTAELCYAESSPEKGEDFVDPTRKTPCSCAKCRRRPRRAPPFHRRALSNHRLHERCAHRPPGRSINSGNGASSPSPGSCGGGSPAAAVSAPSSAGAPQPASPATHLHPQPIHQSNNTVPTTLHTPAPTPDPHAPVTPAPPSLPPPKLYNQSDSPEQQHDRLSGSGAAHVLRRPVLPAPAPKLDPLEDEHELHMLYDYTTVHAWLEHPVKRFKSSVTWNAEAGAGAGADADLYAGHEHTRMPPAHHHMHLNNVKQEHEDTKEYKNLFTSDGLCPNLKDLDQIFDNSDDASGDETVRLLQVSTPPDSNKSGEEGGRVTRMVRAEELSKMFPTPPSMEPHAQPSPGLVQDESHTELLHHHDTPIEDWSYVFKPPTVCKYVGSSKYAPLSSLPSQLLPPLSLPAGAVYVPRGRPAPPGDAPPRPATQQPPPTPEPHTHNNLAGVKRSASPSSAPSSGGGAARRGVAARREQRATAACPLLVNVLLADTVLNVFRDHNFDSCTLCVCNAGPKVVGNILGADAGTYVDMAGAGQDEPSRCSCGYSAVVNRRRAHAAGLFYEDEMEITGLAEEPGGRGNGAALGEVAGELLAQCAAPAPPHEALARAARAHADTHVPDHLAVNLLEYTDGGAAAAKALRAAAGYPAHAGAPPSPAGVHRWPFIGARAPRCSRDVVRLMRRLRPLLQDAIQKRCCGARMWDGVTGPLTWRQFHRLAGRGNEDLCEPQPVPPLLVGHDRDWLSLSPYALRHWERLALEPYSYPRDVAYAVLAPDAAALHEPLRAYFRDLSASYEAARLGRHRPLRRLARDGILRAPAAAAAAPDDEWAGGAPRAQDYVRAYAACMRGTLLPALAALQLDRSLFEPEPRPPPGPEADEGEAADARGGVPSWPEEEEGGSPALVLYVVEPPGGAAARAHTLRALLRLAARTQQHLPHHSPLVKIISLESVCEAWGLGATPPQEAPAQPRALAFSVYCSARRLLQHHANGKSLTGFGTAAAANLFLNSKDEKNRGPYRLFSPAWVLGTGRGGAVVADSWAGGGGGGGGGAGGDGAVLYVAYCLSHDQRWLLAAATDARGELRDTAAINIHVPHRSRRRRNGPARRLGLSKLMDFTLGVMSQAAQPWRLVVGRVGRIGHGELKGWSWLLSRKHLTAASGTLRELCGTCGVLGGAGGPCILSACLVSTEPEPALRLMADRFTPDERFSQHSLHSQLHTPRDVTATHILVFPTSATTQSNQMPFEPPIDNDMMFLNVDMGDEDMGEDNMTDIFSTDMFNTMFAQSSPRREGDEGADGGDGGASPAPHARARARPEDTGTEPVGTVLQQPLALGYLVSTAPLAAMPAWWWAGCAHLRGACPAFLRSALHLHAGAQQAADDFASLMQRRDHNAHPLDSQLTTDVLRYVLEGYNALSWLALDGNTADRVSCLPIHVQMLMQLYHTAAALG